MSGQKSWGIGAMKGIIQEFQSWQTRYNITLDLFPDICPCCHISVTPIFITGFVYEDPSSLETVRAQGVFRCPNHRCGNYFIGNYFKYGQRRPQTFETPFELSSLEPKYPNKLTFPDEISEISPSYCSIFSQAHIAEDIKLPDIAGPGYGKALEFLVKDYLIKRFPAEPDSISKACLGKLIKEKIDDANIRECAMRAAWLRNDETHYLRKWEGKDLDDLKILITLTQNWIQNNILKDRYLEEMQED